MTEKRWAGATMDYEISIDWMYGCPRDPSADEVRAKAAARRVFDRAGVDGCTAQQSYFEQGGLFGNEAAMTGPAAVWLAAQAAAGKAATSGWPDPSRAGVSIECRPPSRMRAAG